MSAEGDSLKIPIEIKTEDLDEIRELINDITRAENDLQTMKATPRKGRGKGDSGSRSAFASHDEDDRGGIFGGQGGGGAGAIRDKTSNTPFQRESEFAKLKNQVQEQEQRAAGGGDAARAALGGASQTIGFASLLGQGGGKGVMGMLGKVAGKAFLPLAVVTTIAEIATNIMDALIAPGGKFDRRFRRDFNKESLQLSSLAEKQEITFGRRIVRVTTIPSQRGNSSQVRSNLDYVKRGVDVFDINGTFNKGIGAGTI